MSLQTVMKDERSTVNNIVDNVADDIAVAVAVVAAVVVAAAAAVGNDNDDLAIPIYAPHYFGMDS